MAATITPMVHVPDVRATALWYRGIGFELAGWHEQDAPHLGQGVLTDEGPPLDWARLRLGLGDVMFSAGGRPSDAPRRDVDLYVNLDPGIDDDGVDALHERLRTQVEVVEAPYDAFHGNRELIVRDLNGFWVTFAQPVG